MHITTEHDRDSFVETRNAGICSTCERLAVCTLRWGDRPVYLCEEFQPAGPQAQDAERNGARHWVPTTRSGSSYLGLCRNCRKLDRCVLAIPGAGKWTCAEYEEIGGPHS